MVMKSMMIMVMMMMMLSTLFLRRVGTHRDGDEDDDDDGVYFLPKEDMCLLTNKINKVTTVNFSDTRCGSEFMAVTSKIVLSRWAGADTLPTSEH